MTAKSGIYCHFLCEPGGISLPVVLRGGGGLTPPPPRPLAETLLYFIVLLDLENIGLDTLFVHLRRLVFKLRTRIRSLNRAGDV